MRPRSVTRRSRSAPTMTAGTLARFGPVEMIIANLTQNAKTAQEVIANAGSSCRSRGRAECPRVKYAMITRPDVVARGHA